MNAQLSSSTRFLKGKQYPGFNSPISRVLVKGGKRIVQLQSGTKIEQTKAQLRNNLNVVLREQQFKTAVKSIREQSSGKVTLKVGGKVKGETLNYSNKQRALAALKRRYKQ